MDIFPVKTETLAAHLFDDEQLLLRRLSKGDQAAFTDIYRIHSERVFKTVHRYVKDDLQAEDLVQQIFIKFWEIRASLAGVRDLKNYFFIASRNTVFNYLKQLSRNSSLMNALQREFWQATAPGTDDLVQQKEYEILLHKGVSQLPLQQRLVYILVEQEQLGFDEVAERMHLSRSTVKKHLELARKSVRLYMNSRLYEAAAVYLTAVGASILFLPVYQ